MDSNTKILGGLGSLFIVLGVIPYAGGVLALVGFILLAIAIKNFSDSQGRPQLFSDFVKGIVIYIVGAFVGLIFGVGSFLSLSQEQEGIFAYGLMVVAFTIMYAATVFGSYYMKKVFSEIALITANGLFDWGGKLLFWGAILTVVAVGAVVSWVGWIVLTVAFFTTQENRKEERDGEVKGAS